MRRFAKPLYGLTPVPRVRIPPSPPVPSFRAICLLILCLMIVSMGLAGYVLVSSGCPELSKELTESSIGNAQISSCSPKTSQLVKSRCFNSCEEVKS
jgi:hypothetical protein